MPRHFNVTVNGVDYQVAVEELNVQPAATAAPAKAPVAPAVVAAPAPTPAPAAAPASAGTPVLAQMGGSIAAVLVKQGQSVSKGDKVIELEAMKMKVPVVATESGQVTSIQVTEGDPVEIGQVLITIG
ncbi:MAG: biotin/lipoyl-binding protein [Propionivibrio sp.]